MQEQWEDYRPVTTSLSLCVKSMVYGVLSIWDSVSVMPERLVDSMAAGQGFWERLLMYGGSFISVSCGTSGEKGRSTLWVGHSYFVDIETILSSYFILFIIGWLLQAVTHFTL